MHLIETYAANSGSKISKPDIYQKLYPLPFQKYVIFQPISKPLKTYDYWSEVLELIVPTLASNNIGIVQVGGPNQPKFRGVYDISGLTDLPQVAFLVNNSLLVFGADSFCCHIASSFGKKIVALYSNNNINNVRPYWSKNEDVTLIAPQRENKPFYALDGAPKEINSIKPEDIAKEIFEKLGIQGVRFNFTTQIFGELFHQKIIETVPDCVVPPSQFGSPNVVVRMDLLHNEDCLRQQMNAGKVILFLDKPIDVDIIRNGKDRIDQIIYKLRREYSTDFAKEVSESGIPYIFLTYEDGEILQKMKFDFMDIGPIIVKPRRNIKDYCKNSKFFYKNGKVIVSQGKFFPSLYSLKKGIFMNDLSSKYFEIEDLETKDFEEEFENYGFYHLAV